MLRNRRSQHDFMRNEFEPPMPPQHPTTALDPKDERLLDLSELVGQLGRENEMLTEDNRRLETDNQKLVERNTELQERNTELERRDSAASAGYKSGSDLVAEIEAAVRTMKESKK